MLHIFVWIFFLQKKKNNCCLSPGGTGVLWWLYAKQRRSPKETVIPEQLQIAEDNLRALLIYAISATVFTVSWPGAWYKHCSQCHVYVSR